jgi:hypothetical protein
LVKKRGRNRARGAAWVAPPPPVQCTATLMAVTIWTWPRASRVEAGTATDGVHRPTRDGAPPVCVRCHRPISLEARENKGAGLGWHRHTLSSATTVCLVTTASQTSHWIRPFGGTATPRVVPPPSCLVPSQKVQLCSNGSIWLGGYK